MTAFNIPTVRFARPAVRRGVNLPALLGRFATMARSAGRAFGVAHQPDNPRSHRRAD